MLVRHIDFMSRQEEINIGIVVPVISLAITQTWVGAASAHARADLLKLMLSLSGPPAILAYAAVKPIHCVRGPEQRLYALDRHHLCVALLQLAAESGGTNEEAPNPSFLSLFDKLRSQSRPLPFPTTPAVLPPFSASVLALLARAHWPVVVVDDLSHLPLSRFILTLRQRSYIAFSDVGRWVVASTADDALDGLEGVPSSHLAPPTAHRPAANVPAKPAMTRAESSPPFAASVPPSSRCSLPPRPLAKRHRPASAAPAAPSSPAPPDACPAPTTPIFRTSDGVSSASTGPPAPTLAPALTARTPHSGRSGHSGPSGPTDATPGARVELVTDTPAAAAAAPTLTHVTANDAAAVLAALSSVSLGPSGVLLEGYSLPRVALPPSLLHLLGVEHLERPWPHTGAHAHAHADANAGGTNTGAWSSGPLPLRLLVLPPFDCCFKSLSWAVRHRAPAADTDDVDSGPGYMAPGWGHYHSSSDWAWRLLCQWARFLAPRIDPIAVMVPRVSTEAEVEVEACAGVAVSECETSAVYAVCAALAGQEVSPSVVAVACGLARLSENMHMPGYLMSTKKGRKRASSIANRSPRTSSALTSALHAQLRAPAADACVEVKVCGGLSSALHVPFYHVPMRALRPTQPTVGLGAVQAKVEKMEKLLARGGYGALLQWLHDSPIPCVLAAPDSAPGEAPDLSPYQFLMVDHHHLCAALYYAITQALRPHLRGASAAADVGDTASGLTAGEFSSGGHADHAGATVRRAAAAHASGPVTGVSLAEPLFSPPPLASHVAPHTLGLRRPRAGGCSHDAVLLEPADAVQVPLLLQPYLLTEMRDLPLASPLHPSTVSAHAHPTVTGLSLSVALPASSTDPTDSSDSPASLSCLSLSPAQSPTAASASASLAARVCDIIGPLHATPAAEAREQAHTQTHEFLPPGALFLSLSPEQLLGLAYCRVVITHNLTDLSCPALWRTLERDGLCYCKLFGKPIDPDTIPRHISGCVNDDFRTLAWMVRRADAGEEAAAMDRWRAQLRPRVCAALQASAPSASAPQWVDSPAALPVLSPPALAPTPHIMPFTLLDVVCARHAGLLSRTHARAAAQLAAAASGAPLDIVILAELDGAEDGADLPALTPGYLKVPTGFLEFLWADYLRGYLPAADAFYGLIAQSLGRAALAVQLSSCLCRLPRAWTVPGHVKLSADAECMRNSMAVIVHACRMERYAQWLDLEGHMVLNPPEDMSNQGNKANSRYDTSSVCSRGHNTPYECYDSERHDARVYLWTLCGRICWLVQQLESRDDFAL